MYTSLPFSVPPLSLSLPLSPSLSLTAQTPCTTNGWFGPNCQYQCHCAGSTDCDPVDGSCSSGCHKDWFGPACQYSKPQFELYSLHYFFLLDLVHSRVVVVVVVVDPKLLSSSLLYSQCQADEGACFLQLV